MPIAQNRSRLAASLAVRNAKVLAAEGLVFLVFSADFQTVPVVVPGGGGESGNATAVSGSTPAEAIEATPASVTKAPIVALQQCPTALSFEVVTPDPSKSTNYSEIAEVGSLQDCVSHCYSIQCTSAGFINGLGGARAQCLLTTAGQPTCGNGAKVSDTNVTVPIEIHCVQCGYAGEATTAAAVGVTEGTAANGTVAAEATTEAPVANVTVAGSESGANGKH